MNLSVAIAGASGYVGGELMRLVALHPKLDLRTVTANSNVGEKVESLHAGNFSHGQMIFLPTSRDSLMGHDVVFLAVPHTKSSEVAAFLDEKTLVIDCGADFRLQDEAAWKKFYGTEHAGTWNYGLPELTLATGEKQRQKLIGQARIAIPGCNVTAVSLALAPALTASLIEPTGIVSVLSVGTSGAGRVLKPNLLGSEVLGSLSAYGVGGVHRHIPEIEQNLAWASGKKSSISFTPVLAPVSRGILAVNTASICPGVSESEIRDAFEEAYSDELFVKVLSPGVSPATGSVLGSNTAAIGIFVDESSRKLIAVSAIDNLVKGTAGAAIQALNIALGFEEDAGLSRNGLTP